MRKAPGRPIGDERRYVPTGLGNATAAPDDQIVVWIKDPTAKQKRAIEVYGGALEIVLDKNGKPAEVGEEGQTMARVKSGDEMDRRYLAVMRHVVKVENYVDQNGEPIKDGADLVEHGETPFVMEVADEILHGVSWSAEQKKKSSRSPGCKSLVTQPSSGIARSADSLASMAQETAKDEQKDSSTLLT